jgi:isoquinoline 1-oxidoreductase subunit beta
VPIRSLAGEREGVAVIADRTWAAMRGRAALRVAWRAGAGAGVDDAALDRQLEAWLDEPGATVLRQDGDVDAALAGAARVVEATYALPLLAHAPMSPLSCTADVTAAACEVWAPTQSPERALEHIARITGLPAAAVTLHRPFVGGSYGRCQSHDFVSEAVQASMAVGQPVRVSWTREDDLARGVYRPISRHRLRGGLDASGRVVAWRYALAGIGGVAMLHAGLGAIRYALGDTRFTSRRQPDGPFVGYPFRLAPSRGVGHVPNAFAVESFVDELAAAAGRDPVELRRELLADAPRHRAVLDEAARRIGWGEPTPPGRGRGVAIHELTDEFIEGAIVAVAFEVSATSAGEVHVERVVAAVDCGLCVNPNTTRAQIEGGVLFGLSAALGEEITISGGRVEQRNFDGYQVLRLPQAPPVEVVLVPGGPEVRGVAEAGVPPVAPALASAVAAATGDRPRRLPLRRRQGAPR